MRRSREYDQLTAPDVTARLSRQSILCLPIGSVEQHGPHLPLNTDTGIAERFTQQLVERYGDQHDLWVLPALPYGLSLEHAWSAGTISLNVAVLNSMLDTLITSALEASADVLTLLANRAAAVPESPWRINVPGVTASVIVDGGICPAANHLTIVDCFTPQARLIRTGLVHQRAVSAALGRDVRGV